ncbi:MAG TPA: hypothetical protein VNL71_00485 [Chloroflexota bacterium]|nr:hypothetical protein [Chloroflexota bacterium]
MSDQHETPASCRFYSVWDNARAREVPMPWAECPGWNDPARLLRRETCCGQPPIGQCRCGRWVYELHAKHLGPCQAHPDLKA